MPIESEHRGSERPYVARVHVPKLELRVRPDPTANRYKETEALQAAALLLNRKTYQGFAAAWPGYEGELADKHNTMPEYLVSSTLTGPEWAGMTVLNGDLTPDVTGLKHKVAGEISVAFSIQLAQSLLALDEIRLLVSPLTLGHGRRLWAHAGQDRWTLRQATVYGDSLLLTICQRRPTAASRPGPVE